MKRTMQAGEFKAKCLKVMDQVHSTKKPLTITKRKVPIVKLVPLDEEVGSLFGIMKGTIAVHGDIIHSVEEKWDACD